MSANAGCFRANALHPYLTEINASPLLSANEERQLAARVAEGDAEARDSLVRSNLRLVVSIAKDYVKRGLPLEDLIAEGNLGLMRAAESFDPSASVRFCTYASYWIKQSIRSALIKYGKPVRLPAYMVNELNKWRRVSQQLTLELGRSPTADEVGQTLRLGRKRQKMVVQALRVAEVTSRLMDVPTGQDQPGPCEAIVDERTRPVEEQVTVADEIAGLSQLLARLDQRESTIIRLRFGLDDGVPMTLDQVGKELGGFTRERVRQLEQRAFAKLRSALN